jgi:23S rRNA C2498 (ribose-2'-O)-methylase RlmM
MLFYKLALTRNDDALSLLIFMNTILKKIVNLAEQNPDVMVVWLYGSRAKNEAYAHSGYDLAVAFKTFIKDDPIEKRLHPECLAIDWQPLLGLHDYQLSIADINQAHIPLGTRAE